MIYPDNFKNLVKRLINEDDTNLNYIGNGNPEAKILIIAKESAINLNEKTLQNRKKSEEQYIEGHKRNKERWFGNIKNNVQLDDDLDRFNPLFPYRWQNNKRIAKNRKKEPNGGTSATWCAYQKLVDRIYGTPKPDKINFLERAFISELSDFVMPMSKYNEMTKESIDIRLDKLFSDPFFRSFPIVILACGHYIRDYKLEKRITEVFDQNYSGLENNENGWINVHQKDGRILLHTRHLSMCKNAFIDDVAKKVNQLVDISNI